MKILEHNSITAFDVDNTLVIWESDFRTPKEGRLKFRYGGEDVYLRPHTQHPMFLKHCFERGDHVRVWSQNGFAWAVQVIEKLKLEKYVHTVESKPQRFVDDKVDLPSVVGNHIFIPEGK